jgi:cephalosporin hydroxylase
VRQISKHFNRVYYANADRTMFDCAWLGTTTVKYPLDLWIYQELIVEQRPQLIVETGTFRGGSAAYFGSICDLLGEGHVVSVDIQDLSPPQHPRVGSSIAPETVAAVHARAEGLVRIFVILDSDHSRDHVLAELHAYSDLVPVGGSLIVEDTNVNGHPVLPEHGPGPYEAVDAFLADNDAFVRDRRSERFMCTANPGGFLTRVR